jgi:long-chain fatty acid transport protein
LFLFFRKESAFFSEEKKQKTFISWAYPRNRGAAGALGGGADGRTPMIKRGYVALVAVGLALPVGAQAAAFQLREGDPDWEANAFAGDSAKAYDAGTAWNNPAGMTRLGNDEIDSGINYFDPGIRFSGQNIVGGHAVSGYSGGDAGPQAVTAGTESVWKYSPDLAFGMAVETPFGLRTAYPGNFVGRYQSLVSAIENFQVALAAAYQITPQFSLGGGPVLSYFRARLTQAINVTAFLPKAGDPVIDIRGDSYAAGYHLGGLYQFTPSFRVGVDYHSRLGQNLGGHQSVYEPPGVRANLFIADVLNAFNNNVETQITLPDYATLSTYYDATPDLALLSTVQWTHWSLIKNIVIYSPGAPESTPVNFRNTWMGSIGANYRLPMLPRLMLQTGLLYDEGANTNATRGPRLPDEDRIGASGGFSFALTKSMSLRMSYLHEFPGFGGNKIDYTNGFPNAGTLVGSYANNADLVSAGVTMKF